MWGIHDEVRFFSQTGERVFTRSPGVIERKVQKCHPPDSVHRVQQILDDFRAGDRDAAEFWIQMGERFIHIRYFAVRDEKGDYRGTLEVVQDVTRIRELKGERRLLEGGRISCNEKGQSPHLDVATGRLSAQPREDR